MNLMEYDFVVMIDKSGSMVTADCPGGMTRWNCAKEYCESIAIEAEKLDDNGIDVVLFNGVYVIYSGVKASKVSEIFMEHSPSGTTDTAGALKAVLYEYHQRKNAGTAKPIIIICITDGIPNNEEDLANVIIKHTQLIQSDEETGISFIQIGKDEGARKFLKRLDDGLESKGAKFDIVDTKNEEEMQHMSIKDIFIQAIQD